MSALLRALFTGTSKHKKLSEEWATLQESVMDGAIFYCKYLGSTLVDDPKGEAATAEAIKRIIHTAKQVSRKPEQVSLHVSLKGIRMEDTTSREVMLQTSIYKISYCSADAHYDHVFAFIANTDNDNCECHAFLCPKKKIAQTVTISIAQAFDLAYKYWKVSSEGRDGEDYGTEEMPAAVTVSSAGGGRACQSQPSSQASSPIPIRSDFGSSDMSTSGYQSSSQALLIDLEDSAEHQSPANLQHTKTQLLSNIMSTYDELDDISDGFSRLALRRGHQPPPLAGVTSLPLDEFGLAALAAHQANSPTDSGFWPMTSPVASPPSNWEMFSQSPNTAFLHSCHSPPNSSSSFSSWMFSSSVDSGQAVSDPMQSPQSPTQLIHSPQSAFHHVQSSPQPIQSPRVSGHPNLSPQSPRQLFQSSQSVFSPIQSAPLSIPSPTHAPDQLSAHSSPITNPFPFTDDFFFTQEPEQASSPPLSSNISTGKENPFLPANPTAAATNPFLPCPANGPIVGSPKVVVAQGRSSGCSPSRPMWNANLFGGSKSKDVVCS